MAEPSSRPPQPAVLAVVVSPGTSRFLTETLAGIGAQETAPDGVLVVDVTAVADPGHARILALRAAAQKAGISLERVRVVQAPGARTFGEAVRAGLAELGTHPAGEALAAARWYWFLHDDSAPEPSALRELLRGARSGPTVAITGPKQRDWADPERIVALGVTVSRTGRRYVGFEDGELDQGQHDHRVDVYGVGTAGAVVRSDVWRELEGIDPALGPFNDGLDLSRRARLAGYRVIVAPRAVVRHARAGYRGLRPANAGTAEVRPDIRRSYRARRAAHLYSRLVEARPWVFPFLPLVLVLAAVARALVRVLTKEFRLAVDELAATATVLARPRAIWRARRRARGQRSVPVRRLRPLLATQRQVWASTHERRLSSGAARGGRVVRSELEIAERAALARRRRSTSGILAAGFTALAALVFAPYLALGVLQGGALLPLTSDLGTIWEHATGAWVQAGDGYRGPADPFLYVLSAATALAGGSARVAVTALVLGAIPIAGLGAWFASGAATRSVRLRAWATVVWTLSPPLLLAVGQGRVGPVVAHLALPWVALGVARALGVQRRDDLAGIPVAAEPGRTGSVAAAAGAGLALAVAVAGAPVLLPAVVVGLVLLAPLVRRRAAMLVIASVPPVVIAAPLLLAAARDVAGGSWRILFADPGAAVASRPGASYLPLLAWPTPPPAWPLLPEPAASLAPLVATGLVVLGALVALLRRGRERGVQAGWVVLLAGLATAVAAPRVEVGIGTAPPGLPGHEVVRGWAGTGTSLVLLGVLVAILAAADGLMHRLTSSSFGLRQVAAAVLAVLLVLAPAATTLAWTWRVLEARSAGAPTQLLALGGRGPNPVPALGLELQRAGQDARVLALEPVGEELSVRLWRAEGEQLTERAAVVTGRALRGMPGAPELVPPDAAEQALAELAAAIAVGAAGNPSAALAEHAIGVVVVPPGSTDARDRLVARIDSTPGLERVTENLTGTVWRVAPERGGVPVARARIVSADGTPTAVLPSDGTVMRGELVDGPDGRLLVLAERADPNWRAWLDGQPLRGRSLGWRQAFVLPAEGGELVASYHAWSLTLLHSGQAAALAVYAVLALPLRRRKAGVSE